MLGAVGTAEKCDKRSFGRTYSITSSARARSAGGLRDQLRRKTGPTPNPASAHHLGPQYSSFCSCLSRNAKVGNPTELCALVRQRGNGGGDEARRLVGHRLVSRAALQFKGGAPMSTIAAAAQELSPNLGDGRDQAAAI